MVTVCVIKNKTQKGVYWQRGNGWVQAQYATEFELNETKKLPLPPDGEWVQLDHPTIPRRAV